MQLLHPFAGSIQQYPEQLADPGRYRPDRCPQCQARHPLTSHGFYHRTLVDLEFDDTIRVRRYLCRFCKRTVSLLPEFALPYLRFSVAVIALFLIARLLDGRTLKASVTAAAQPAMAYQRGQFWIRRFQRQAATLCAGLASLTKPLSAADCVTRALHMLGATGWVAAHRFLLSHCTPTFWAGPVFWLPTAVLPPSGSLSLKGPPHSICLESTPSANVFFRFIEKFDGFSGRVPSPGPGDCRPLLRHPCFNVLQPR